MITKGKHIYVLWHSSLQFERVNNLTIRLRLNERDTKGYFGLRWDIHLMVGYTYSFDAGHFVYILYVGRYTLQTVLHIDGGYLKVAESCIVLSFYTELLLHR